MIGLLFFSVAIRTRIKNLLVGTGYYLAGTWNNISPTIRDIMQIGILIGIIGWATMIALMIGLGAYANSIGWAIFISIVFPFWFIAFIMPPALNKLWVFGPIFRISRCLICPLAIAMIVLLIGVWSPAVKSAIDRKASAFKNGAAISLNESSSHSESESGSFRKVSERTMTVRNRNDDSDSFVVESGDVVKIASWNGIQATEFREGFSRIVAKNILGHYDGAKVGWVPTRLLEEGASAPKSPETDSLKSSLIKNFPATIEITGGKNYFKSFEMSKGKYKVSPVDTEVNLGEGRKVRKDGKFEVLNDRQVVGVCSPTGAANVTIDIDR